MRLYDLVCAWKSSLLVDTNLFNLGHFKHIDIQLVENRKIKLAIGLPKYKEISDGMISVLHMVALLNIQKYLTFF